MIGRLPRRVRRAEAPLAAPIIRTREFLVRHAALFTRR